MDPQLTALGRLHVTGTSTVNDSDGLEATDVLDRPIAKTMPTERRVLSPLGCANE